MPIDVSKYKDMFISEAKDNLQILNSSLLKLEKKPGDKKLIDEMFRAAHTLKGMTATMKYNKMAELCHTIEDVMDEVKKKERKLTPEIIQVFFDCFDNLDLSLKQISKDEKEVASTILLSKLKQIKTRPKEEVTEEAEGESLAQRPEAIEKIKEIKVKVETLDTLMSLAEELLVNKMRLDQLHESKKLEEMFTALTVLGRLVADLQYSVMQARMVPVEQIFGRFPRMIRDIATKQKEQVNLVVEGGDIELDRTVIDKLGEPLVHLLRNAVDHGIESPEERKAQKKSTIGTVRLVARREKEYAVIEVEDDGRGVSDEEIKKVAMEKGIITREEAARLSHDDTMTLMCDNRFSTTKKVTEYSGRGVGLNVVKTMVDSLGGTLKIDSKPGKGTKVTMKLPLTLAIIKALLTKVGDDIYAIPVTNVVRSIRLRPQNIKKMLDHEVAVLPKQNVPLLRLYDLFNIPHEKEEGVLMVMVNTGSEFIGLGVDELVDEQDIIIKPLDKLVKRNKAFAGFTILGDGRAVLIVDVANIGY